MGERFESRCQRYIEYLFFCMKKPQNIPIKLWKDYQPKLSDAFSKEQKKNMHQTFLPFFKNKRGICIGGTLRWVFQDYLKQAEKVVNVDIVPGMDYVTDATDFYFADDGEFDFVCSSHVLEHVANPLKALREWIRVVKSGGIIYCAVPDKRFTFDHRRKRTTLQHLIEDYSAGVCIKDETHLIDIVSNVDLSLDPTIDKEKLFQWRREYIRSEDVTSLMQHHHHVYTKDDVVALFKFVGLEIVFVALRSDTVHLIAKKWK